MGFLRSLKLLSFLFFSILFSEQSFAAGLGQQSIEEVLVAQHSGALTAVSSQQARAALEAVPGAIGFVDADDFRDNFTQSIGDTLVFTPGVYADTSAQRENRISIRGSGLNASFERRGLSVLRDGIPISRASGITEFQEIDPLSIQYIEVFKGANGLRYGAASLGGAINIVTPTGVTQDSGTSLRLEGGSFGTVRSSINTAGKANNIDYYGAVTKLNSDGFRNHSDVDSTYSFGNIGFAISDNIETRFYLTALQDNFELAGSLTQGDALTNPERSGTSNETFDQDRNLDVYRISNRTVVSLDSVFIEIAAWAASRELDHAITPFVGIIDQKETEQGLSLQLNSGNESAVPFTWVAGINYAKSDNEAKVFANNFGNNGALRSEDDQDAKNFVAFGQIDTSINEQLNVIASLQYVESERTNKNILPIAVIGSPDDDNGSLTFNQTNGRIGLLWQATDTVQYFANISQGYEPPGISDITSGGALPFTELQAQESITFELGTRGQYGILAWDAAVYRSEIEHEFIDVAAPGFGAGTVTKTDNAVSDTVHQGLELGVDVQLLDGANRNDWQLLWRNIFTYNDFRFENDPSYGDNTLAGVPEAIYVTELTLSHAEAWHAGLNFRHIANGAWVDYANSNQAPGYHLVGLSAGAQLTPALRVFASAENIFDKRYIANISTVADLSTESNKAVFTPGEGRSAYMGLSYTF